MAKNWTIAEAYKAIKDGDKSAVLDFGKRFPLATLAVSNLSGAEMLVEGLPEHVTMRKLDSVLKEGVEAFEEDETEKPKKVSNDTEKKSGVRRGRPPKNAPKVEEEEDTSELESKYEGMSAVELFKLCKKRGLTVQPKQKSKAYIDILVAADKKLEAEDVDEDEEDDWEEEEEPKKAAKKPVKAAKNTKADKKVEESEEDEEDDEDDSEDEDDSWDI